MMGGFSQAEMISYLRAKQSAGVEVLREIKEEESRQIGVAPKKEYVTEQKQMEATMEEKKG